LKLLILSDIHGNVSALNAVLEDIGKKWEIDRLAMLGDFIDYGMRSNEVIQIIRNLDIVVVCNIWGNHERAIVKKDYAHFSSDRGVVSARNTRRHLTQDSLDYLESLPGIGGKQEFEWAGKKFLAIHGSLTDAYWKAIFPIKGNGTDGQFEGYEKYDYVLSGHSHCPHVFPIFYNDEKPECRNKKRTIFINPGSVGQPRNHDPRAQYAILDTENGVSLCVVQYDIECEQSLFTDEVDSFYRERLMNGV